MSQSSTNPTAYSTTPASLPRRKSMQHLRFRPDVEGLRAIAILLVVITHAGFEWLPGGFIGVDIFFVISGYLITRLLVSEIQAHGKLDWLAFVARRLKRLLPALLAMLIGVFTLSVLLLSPFDQYRQADAAQYAAIWASNIHFALANTGYFEPSAERNLFLHTWSLGVEEQFYLFWPALILLLLVWTRRSGSSQARLLIGLLVVCGLSLVFSLTLTQYRPVWAFYLMPGRIWEFGAGALVFALRDFGSSRYTLHIGNQPVFTPRLQQTLAIAALVALPGIALLLNPDKTYPGLLAILPVAATVILLMGHPALLANRVLASKFFRFIGTLSYSWYLWHWPVLVLFTRYLGLTETIHRLLAILISLVLAWLSYQYVEKPARQININRTRTRVTLGMGVVVTGVMLIANFTWRENTEQWIASPEINAFNELASELSEIYHLGCDDGQKSADLRVCQFGSEDATRTAVMFGDSILAQWFPALKQYYTANGWKLLVATKSACPMVTGSLFYKRIGREYTECVEWRKTGLEWITALKPDVVFTGSSLKYANVDNWASGTSTILETISTATETVYVMQGTNTLPFQGPNCLAQRYWQSRFFPPIRRCEAIPNQTDAAIKRQIEEVTERFANVHLIDMNPVVCADNLCSAAIDNKVIYRDHQHLSINYVEGIAPILHSKLIELHATVE
ncbi:MAG: acyltransferase [Gammaproteobacteria bacterium]|nr:acyltransferase [Gammaproteobacteria bacterium]